MKGERRLIMKSIVTKGLALSVIAALLVVPVLAGQASRRKPGSPP